MYVRGPLGESRRDVMLTGPTVWGPPAEGVGGAQPGAERR
jgi:hypothetical protein